MKNLKFKKITGDVNFEDGHVSQKTWAFNMAWLNSIPSRGNSQLRNLGQRKMLENVTTKMQGGEVRTIGTMNVINAVDLDTFKKTDLKEAMPVKGFKRGDITNKTVVYFQLNRTCIDVEFYAALTWDSDTAIYTRGQMDPVILVKNSAIVALIAPVLTKK